MQNKSSKVAVFSKSVDEFCKFVKDKHIEKADCILIRPDLSEINFKESRSYQIISIDKLISIKEIDQATADIELIKNKWYLDRAGKDFTIFNNISFGNLLIHETEEIFYQIVLYYLAIEKLTNTHNRISNSCEDKILLGVLEWFDENSYENIEINYVKNYKEPINTFMPIESLNHRLKGNNLSKLFSKFLQFIFRKKEKTLFVLDFGKLDKYFKFFSSNPKEGLGMMIPIRKNFLSRGITNISFYHGALLSNPKEHPFDIEHLKNQIDLETKFFKKKFIRFFISKFLLIQFYKLASIHDHYENIFEHYKPKLSLFGSDKLCESVLIATLAKRFNSKNILMTHGLEFWGRTAMQNEIGSPFDLTLSSGKFEQDRLLNLGHEENRIIDFSFPWFSRDEFIKKTAYRKNMFRLNNDAKRRKALILPMDPGYSLYITPSYLIGYIKSIISICKVLNIDIHGIKFRTENAARFHGLQLGKNLFQSESINAFAGYGSISKFFDSIDLIIGPVNSATIETIGAGIKYYSFHDFRLYKGNQNFYKGIEQFMHIAKNSDELKNNIHNELLFKSNKSLESIVNQDKSEELAFKRLSEKLINFVDEVRQ